MGTNGRTRWIAALTALLLLAGPALAGETGWQLPQPSVLPRDRVLPPEEGWEPPVIDESVLETEPWLMVIKVAQEELGYTEGPLKDQSKYGEWYAGKRVAWCAEFLSWCVHQTDERYGTSLYGTVYPQYGRAKEGVPWFVARGQFVTDDDRVPQTHEKQWLIGDDHYLENNEYIPFPGDYLWIAWYSSEIGTDHVALVEDVTRDADGEVQIHVIEGNNPDKVQRNTYPLSYKLLYGFGTPVRRAYTDVGLYDTCDDIFVLQSFLTRKGYLKPRKVWRKQIDRTVISALRSYQKSIGVKQTAMMDLATRTVMEQDEDYLAAMQEIYP